MMVETRNQKKLVFAARKAMRGGVQLMADGDLVYSVTLDRRSMHFRERRARLERARATYLDLGAFNQQQGETLYQLFLRLWDEAKAGGCALPQQPPHEQYVLTARWREPKRGS